METSRFFWLSEHAAKASCDSLGASHTKRHRCWLLEIKEYIYIFFKKRQNRKEEREKKEGERKTETERGREGLSGERRRKYREGERKREKNSEKGRTARDLNGALIPAHVK